MDAREAVGAAKSHVLEMFADEDIHSIGLEEIRFEEGGEAGWAVTIGFVRDWRNDTSVMRAVIPPPRTYKIVTLAADGSLRFITNRDVRTEPAD